MKIFVNNIPHKPKDCLFAVNDLLSTVFGEPRYVHRCTINNRICDLECGKNCNKLRCIF